VPTTPAAGTTWTSDVRPRPSDARRESGGSASCRQSPRLPGPGTSPRYRRDFPPRCGEGGGRTLCSSEGWKMQADLEAVTAELLAAARRAGADDADALAVAGEHLSIEVRDGALEQAERAEGIDVGLRVLIGRRQACVSASDHAPRDHRGHGRARGGDGARGARGPVVRPRRAGPTRPGLGPRRPRPRRSRTGAPAGRPRGGSARGGSRRPGRARGQPDGRGRRGLAAQPGASRDHQRLLGRLRADEFGRARGRDHRRGHGHGARLGLREPGPTATSCPIRPRSASAPASAPWRAPVRASRRPARGR
jgi:hypothetical protein